MNSGKRFEMNVKTSVPSDVFYYRFKDGTSSWDKGENTRFQHKNICDCLLFYQNKLFLIECKSHKGKSLPLSCIRTNQVEELLKANKYDGIVAGLIIEFSDIKEYYFLEINQLLSYTFEFPHKKSIPVQYLRDNSYKISHELKKVNVRLDIKDFIENYK